MKLVYSTTQTEEILKSNWFFLIFRRTFLAISQDVSTERYKYKGEWDTGEREVSDSLLWLNEVIIQGN